MTPGRYASSRIDGGPIVLTESIPGLRSAAVGVWVPAGPVHEVPAELGASHLLEHMVFKGSARRSARDFALALERLGGSLDAYTSREHTSYQARVLDEHVGVALDVLADLILNPMLRVEDLRLEREVVLEEISAVEDTPDDLVFDLHASALWGDHPYGYPILGTRESVAALTTDHLRGVHRRRYRPADLVVAAAGSVEHERVVDLAAELFPPGPAAEPPAPLPRACHSNPHEQRFVRATSQTHLVAGTATFGHSDPRRYALGLLANAMGGGMSSRLFQRVREELGLAYAVYTFTSFYRDSGVLGVYVGTRPEWADRAAEVVREEMERLVDVGLEASELEDTKSQLKGNLVISLESTGARLHRLAATALYDEPYQSLEEMVARVDAVTQEALLALAGDFFDPDRQVSVRLGPETS